MSTNTTNFKINNRRAIFSELVGYCPSAKEGKGDFIEVTEWTNGEGFDIVVSNVTMNTKFSLTHGEFKLLKKLVKYLYNDEL
jgi:hypothetical protein